MEKIEADNLFKKLTESSFHYSESTIIGPYFTYNGYYTVETFAADFIKNRHLINKNQDSLCQNQEFISKLEQFSVGISHVPNSDSDFGIVVNALAHYWNEDESPLEEGRSNVQPTKEIFIKGEKFVRFHQSEIISIISILNNAKAQTTNKIASSSKSENWENLSSPIQFKLKEDIDKGVFLATLALVIDQCMVTKQKKALIAKTFAPYFHNNGGQVSSETLERIFSFEPNRISDSQLEEVEAILNATKLKVDELLLKVKGIYQQRNK